MYTHCPATFTTVYVTQHDDSVLMSTFVNAPYFPLYVFQEDLFQTPGLQEELQNLIDCLDTSIPDSIRILLL